MLTRELIAAIKDPNTDWDAEFELWALRIFGHQFEANIPYRRYCEGRGVGPHNVHSYREIPAVPTDVFKHVELTTAPGESIRIFRTSGTTQGSRGAHHFVTLDAYSAAVPGPFKAFVFPDATQMPFAVLAPPPNDMPESSLSYWLDRLMRTFGEDNSAFFINTDSSGLVFDFEGVSAWLSAATGPVFMVGTAFAFVEFFDTVDGSWSLPDGSRVLETGGLKGRTREVTREDLYRMFIERLGIPESRCVSEYSMTELSSQAYSTALRDGVPWTQAHFETPPWAKVELVDPMTMEILDGDGARGLICWYDLANVDSVIGVQTSDIGIRRGRGFELVGRASDAELRGCSLTIEEIVG